MANKKDLIVYKPNELIEIVNRPISAVGLKVYNSILQKLQDLGTDRVTVSLNEIIIDNSKNYEDIYSYLDELQKVQVKSIDKRGKSWGSFVLLSEYKKTDNGIFVAVPPSIHNALCGKDKKQENLYYTAIKLLEEKSFKCSYSIILYEIFKKYEKVSIPIYSIEDLRQMTKTENKYKVYYEFKRWVLNPAIKEINSFDTKYIYSFSEEYLGRKVDKIKFTKVLKETKEPQLVLTDNFSKTISSENLLLAIEKVKKNIHIARKFSKRAVNNAVKQYGEEIVIAGLERMSTYNFPIEKFANFLTYTLSEVKKEKEVKRTPAPTIKKEEKVVPPTPIVEKIKKTELNKLDKLRSDICSQARNQLETNELVNLFTEIMKTSSKEEVLEVIKKYDLEINLTLI